MMQTMQIRLTRELISEIKMLVDMGIYPNVSEAVRDSVRMLVTSKERPTSLPESRKEEIEVIQEKIQEEVKKQVKENLKKPKGTTDFTPQEMNLRTQVFNTLRKTSESYGFNEVEPPAFETLATLTKKSGEETINQIFTLEQKGSEKFGLRFDLTVPITRMFIEKQREIPKPAKWFGLSRMWRYERPQAGRLREFYQLSVELFGSKNPEADAEVINLAINCLTNLKLTKDDFYVRINNRKLLQGLLEEYTTKENIEKLIALVDKKDKLRPEDFLASLKDLNIKNPEELKKLLETDNIDEIKPNSELAKEGLKELKEVIKLSNKDFLKVDLTVARGLAYYTGTVFELFDKSGKYRALAGGGRYDNMVKLFGGEDCPATGFGLGYSTLSLLLKDKGLMPEAKSNIDYYIATISQDVKEDAIQIANKLREKYNVSIDLMQRNLGNQFKYANSIKAKKVIVIGPDEIKKGKVNIKDMATGEQVEKDIKDI
jgi:histidyl-tRNA synthetase